MAVSRKPAKEPGIPGKPKTGKKPTGAPPAKKTAPKTAKPAAKPVVKKEAAAKPGAVKKPAPKPAAKPAPKKPAPKPAAKPAPVKPQADKKTVVKSKSAPRKPLPGAVPAQIIDFLDRFDALKPGKTWAAKAANLIGKIPAALFGDFEDALDLGTPLSTGRIPLHLIDPGTAKAGAAKSPKGGGLTVRPAQKTFGTAVLGNKIGREDLEELVERLRCCLCCCHCWPCRPWPFCRICRRWLVKVSSTADSGWVYHLNFLNASAAIADREAKITCPSDGSAGGPWAPQVWNASTPPAAAPVGYSEAGHDHDADYAPISGSTNYAAAGHNHNTAYAPISGSTNYAAVGHNHNTAYAPINGSTNYAAAGHNHDTAYAPINGSTNYAAVGHNHDTAYAPISGSTNYAAMTHVHKKTQAGRLENPLSAAGGLVTVNLSNMTPTVLANIKVHATAFGKKTMAPFTHIPLYVTDISIGGTLAAPTVTFTIQHADGTLYNSGDTMTWGIYAKMILSFVATENL